TRAHAAHVGSRARCDYLREIPRYRDFTATAHRRVELANKQTVSAQLKTTISTTVQMIFEELGEICIQFAVNIGAHETSVADLFDCRIAHWIPVIPFSTNCCRIISRARNSRFFTVPSGRPVTSTISS